MAASAAMLWGVNGTVSKVILASGISSLQLAQVLSDLRDAGRVVEVAHQDDPTAVR